MITNLDPESTLFLADTNRIQKRAADANSQVSSGKRVRVASDAPDEIGAILQLRANQQQNAQVQANLALATTDANAADNSLSSAIKLMDTALGLAAQGTAISMDANGRNTLAQQVRAIQQQMVAYSQTTVQGRYIFSGDQEGDPSYQYQTGAAAPVVRLAASASTRQVEDPAGGSFGASKTALEIFDHSDPISGAPSADNVFAALDNLAQALETNNTGGISDLVASLKAASDHLNSMEAFYGNVQTRIQNAGDFASSYDIQLQTELSQKEDADVTSAALELTQANTQLQAAFQMRAQRPHTSLFSY